MPNKAEIIQYLEQEKERLTALVLYLESQGVGNPQYHQLDNCKKELKTVISQLERLNK